MKVIRLSPTLRCMKSERTNGSNDANVSTNEVLVCERVGWNANAATKGVHESGTSCMWWVQVVVLQVY
eukprot:m.15720 g.15720  ORF g.15720 m.15720 type:complete len:68 (-) comp6717_c0_seq1:37-240(-)